MTEEEADGVVEVLERICTENGIWYDLIKRVKIRNGVRVPDKVGMRFEVKINHK